MNYKTLLFCLLMQVSYALQAQDCKCLDMNIVKAESGASEQKDQIKVRVKNNCIVRKWFYTPAFWIKVVADEGTAKTSVLHKLHTDLPEFIQFKWKEEKILTFNTDMNISAGKVQISYENTDHVYPSRLFGSKTYRCATEIGKKDK